MGKRAHEAGCRFLSAAVVREHLLPQAHYHVPDGWLKKDGQQIKIKLEVDKM